MRRLFLLGEFAAGVVEGGAGEVGGIGVQVAGEETRSGVCWCVQELEGGDEGGGENSRSFWKDYVSDFC